MRMSTWNSVKTGRFVPVVLHVLPKSVSKRRQHTELPLGRNFFLFLCKENYGDCSRVAPKVFLINKPQISPWYKAVGVVRIQQTRRNLVCFPPNIMKSVSFPVNLFWRDIQPIGVKLVPEKKKLHPHLNLFSFSSKQSSSCSIKGLNCCKFDGQLLSAIWTNCMIKVSYMVVSIIFVKFKWCSQ